MKVLRSLHLHGFAHMGRAIEQVVEHVLDHSLAINHVGDPGWQQAEGFGHAEGSAQALVTVAQQRKRQLMAFREAAMAYQIVTADAPDLSTKLLQLLVGIPESAGFCGAARGLVFRIEEQHQGRAVALADGAAVAFVILQDDGWNAVTNGEGHAKQSNWWRNLRKRG